MADQYKAAPLASAAGVVTETPEAQQYQEALNQSMLALEQRLEPRTNLFNIAAGFLKPTRGGSFGESLGNVNEALGKEQERQSQEVLPIAQMRAQLAGQKYQMALEAKSQQALANAIGGFDQADIAQAMSTPQGAIGNPALYQRLANAQMAMTPGTKGYEQVKNMLETQKNMIDLGIKQGQLTNDQAKLFFETGLGKNPFAPQPTTATPTATQPSSGGQAPIATGGVVPRETVANVLGTAFDIKTDQLSTTRTREQQQNLYDRWKAGEKGIYMPVNPADFPDKKEFHTNALDVPQSVPEKFMNSLGWYRPFPEKDPVHYEPMGTRSAQAPVAQAPVAQTGQPATAQPVQTTSATGAPLSPKAQQEVAVEQAKSEQQVRKQAMEEENKPWIDKTKEILRYDDYATKQNLARTDQIQKILAKNPQIVGLLQNADQEGLRSWLQAVGAAAQEGIQLGNYGSISVPIEKFISTGSLNKSQKAALAELSRHINNEFFAGMKSNRNLLGINPTDNDARLYQAAMAGTGNLAENIYSWAQSKAAEYEAMNQMYKGYVAHRKQYGTTDPSSYYTSETSPYHSAVDVYGQRINKIYQQAPGVTAENQ